MMKTHRTSWAVCVLLAGVVLSGVGTLAVRLRPYWVARYGGEGADLRGVSLRGAPLSRADLFGADLTGANLQRADLRRANLSQAGLKRTNIRGASLRGANLSDADLTGANLQGADLQWADLSGALLKGADLRYAELAHAVLDGTDLRDTTLQGTNLSQVWCWYDSRQRGSGTAPRQQVLADTLVARAPYRKRQVRGEPQGFMGVRARCSVWLPLVLPAWRLCTQAETP
jgi:Pentapeptide repeats (8 copies)